MKTRKYNPTKHCTTAKTLALTAWEQPSGAIKVVRNRIQIAWFEPDANIKTVNDLVAAIRSTTGCNQFIVELHRHRSHKIETRGYPADRFWNLLYDL